MPASEGTAGAQLAATVADVGASKGRRRLAFQQARDPKEQFPTRGDHFGASFRPFGVPLPFFSSGEQSGRNRPPRIGVRKFQAQPGVGPEPVSGSLKILEFERHNTSSGGESVSRAKCDA
jgi:hypothetical protein